MKLAVFRFADRMVLGQVDAEGEAMLLGAPSPETPHEYVPREDGVELSTGPLCRTCAKPKGHQVHDPDALEDVDEDDDAGAIAGPIPVRVYDPVETYITIVPVQTPMGSSGLGVAKIPEVLRASSITVHVDRAEWVGLYTLEGEVLEGIAQDYLNLVKPLRAADLVTTPTTGRRRVIEG